MACFLLLHPASHTCSMPRQDFLGSYLPTVHKILSKFSKISAILKTQGENLSNNDINSASVL